MKHFVLPRKHFTKADQYTFTDDGHTFTGFLYNNTVPVTKCTLDGYVFLEIRADYIVPCEFWPEGEYRWVNKFDGVSYSYAKEHFQEFIDECDKAYMFLYGYINFELA